MKKTIIFLFASCLGLTLNATKYTIVTSGTSYSPSSVNAVIGDTISIAGSSVHPAVQVDQSTWTANGNTPLAGGWGTKTSTYTFTASSPGSIYFVCNNHHAMGMKGVINVSSSGIKTTATPANSVQLFPNPANAGEFSVKMDNANSTGKLILYTIEGKIAEVHLITATLNPVKTKLPAGAYVYSIFMDGKEILRDKIIVTDK